MTPEQALGNFAALINLGIQRGLFQSADEVHAMTEAHNVLSKLKSNLLEGVGSSDQMPGYVTTNTNNFKTPSFDHVSSGTTTKLPENATINNTDNAKS